MNIAIINDRKKEKKTLTMLLKNLFETENNGILSEEEIIRLNEIQILLSNEKKISLSLNGVIHFLLRAMSYNKVQLDSDEETRFKEFLSTITDEDILALYDVEENYDEKNLRSIDSLINTSNIDNAFGMQIKESGDGSKPVITEASRKKLAKSLLNRDK